METKDTVDEILSIFQRKKLYPHNAISILIEISCFVYLSLCNENNKDTFMRVISDYYDEIEETMNLTNTIGKFGKKK
jgi:hypothetical protein